MNIDELMKKLFDIAAEARNAETVPEVVIYPETSEVSKFLGIKSINYDVEKNRIRINAMNIGA